MQVPHCSSPQPNFVPINPRWLRKTSSNGVSGSAATLAGLPFTRKVVDGIRGPAPYLLVRLARNYFGDYDNDALHVRLPGVRLTGRSLRAGSGQHLRRLGLVAADVRPILCRAVALLAPVVIGPARQIEPNRKIALAVLLGFLLGRETRGREARWRRCRGCRHDEARPQQRCEGQSRYERTKSRRHREPPFSRRLFGARQCPSFLIRRKEPQSDGTRIRERPVQSSRTPPYCAGMDYGAANKQIERLSEIVRAAPSLMQVLRTVCGLGLPDWLVMSGAVYQPVLNHLTGRPADYGIRDYDLGYFDASDISYEAEDSVI